MAIIALHGGMFYGGYLAQSAGVPSFATIAVNGADDRGAVIFRAPRDGMIEAFGMRVGSGVLTNGIRFAIQDIDLSTGFPDGIDDQFRVIPFTQNSFLEAVLTSDGTDGGTRRSVTQGELLAIVAYIETFQSGDSFNFALYNEASAQFPCAAHNGGAGYTRVSARPTFALKYSDGNYEFIAPRIFPADLIGTTHSFSSSSDPDERALRFKLPARMRVGGCWVRITLAGNTDIVLYNAAGDVLRSVSLDSDVKASTSNHDFFVRWADIDLDPNVVYYLAAKPTTTTSVTIVSADVVSQAHLGGFEGGVEWFMSSRTDGGLWSDSVLQRPMMGLWITGIDDGAGGTGGTGSSNLRVRTRPWI